MRDDSRQFGPPAVAPDPTAAWQAYSWAMRNLLGQDQEHSPRRKIRTIAASDKVNKLDQCVFVSATATATLETAVAADNRWHVFVNTGSGTMTIACTGSETISGAATRATSTQYAAFFVFSDGTNWHAITFDLANALGTLALSHGGTGAATASAAWKTLSANQTPLPLMPYGGMNFNGTTTYLDTNALTGIADGKKFTWVGVVRFANAASGSEIIFSNTGTQFQVRRTNTGNIEVVAENAAGSQILNQATNNTPCSAAGTYVLMVSADMATAGSFTLYINDAVASVTSTTFTNDTIDFTVAEYSIGATAAGASFFAGDMYLIYFLSTNNLDFSSEIVRRRFIDTNAMPQWLGSSGELPAGNVRPIGFWAYGDSDLWYENRGTANATIFTKNGTIADATTVLKGQYGDGIWRTWTPTRTGWTDVGTPTSTGRYCQIRNVCYFQAKVVPGTTTATTAGTSYISLPLTANPQAFTGDGSMENLTTFVAIGMCVFDMPNSRCYVPTQAATGNTLDIAGWFEV
jgi:hypothetical protein